MIPVVFGPNGKQLMGIYHAPEPNVALGAGVVLCNPLGYEAMCAHRTYRHLARRLAEAGFDVLRFDYQGTGDSSGRSDEPDRVRAWVDSVSAAVDELRAIAGVTAIDLCGVRFGATLAALAAGERRDIRGLVLWAPAVSGRAYVREVRALQMLKGNGERGTPHEQGGQDAIGLQLCGRQPRGAIRLEREVAAVPLSFDPNRLDVRELSAKPIDEL